MLLTTEQIEHMDNIIQAYRRRVIKAEKRGRDPYKSGGLAECRIQHLDMAAGGHGGPTGLPDGTTIRGEYYKGYPNAFFTMICNRMGWEEDTE
jgi:hypothetical protein